MDNNQNQGWPGGPPFPGVVPGQMGDRINPGPERVSGYRRLFIILAVLGALTLAIIIITLIWMVVWNFLEFAGESITGFFDGLGRMSSNLFRGNEMEGLTALGMILIAVLGAIRVIKRRR